MEINGIEYKKYDDVYYVSAYGDVYSTHLGECLKHSIDHDGYHRVDIHRTHIKVHKLVFLLWCGDIAEGKQINHIDDNKDNNHYLNLYQGDQKENIADCIENNHRCGNVLFITVLNKQTGEIEEYPMIKDFLKSTGHPVSNGSLSKVIKRKWFVEKYEILNLERCRDYRKLVEAKASRVARDELPCEAQGTVLIGGEEIVHADSNIRLLTKEQSRSTLWMLLALQMAMKRSSGNSWKSGQSCVIRRYASGMKPW